MKRGLIIASVGCDTAFVVGALEALIRSEHRRYDAIGGFGLGALCAAVLCQGAQGIQAAVLTETWSRLRFDAGDTFGGPGMGQYFGPQAWGPLFDLFRATWVSASRIALLVSGQDAPGGPVFTCSGGSPSLWPAIKAASGLYAPQSLELEDGSGLGLFGRMLGLGVTRIDVLAGFPFGWEPRPAPSVSAHGLAFLAKAKTWAPVFECGVGHVASVPASLEDRVTIIRPPAGHVVRPLALDPFSVRAQLDRGRFAAREHLR